MDEQEWYRGSSGFRLLYETEAFLFARFDRIGEKFGNRRRKRQKKRREEDEYR